MDLSLIVFGALLVIAAIAYLVSLYNGLSRAKAAMDKSWGDIDSFLKQRHDELPRLVDYCNRYMAQEKGAFDRVMQARDALMNAKGPVQKARAEGAMHQTLVQLFAIAEKYPDLKAQLSFQQLQDRVSALETAVTERLQAYNDSVKAYNAQIQSMPYALIAKVLGFTAREVY